MAGAAEAAAPVFGPKVVKISSKRQITIPAEAYQACGFADYALVTLTSGGIEVRPVDVEEERLDVRILASLVEQGLEGEELVREFKAAKDRTIALKRHMREAEEDLAAGRVHEGDPTPEILEIGRKHGLHD